MYPSNHITPFSTLKYKFTPEYDFKREGHKRGFVEVSSSNSNQFDRKIIICAEKVKTANTFEEEKPTIQGSHILITMPEHGRKNKFVKVSINIEKISQKLGITTKKFKTLIELETPNNKEENTSNDYISCYPEKPIKKKKNNHYSSERPRIKKLKKQNRKKFLLSVEKQTYKNLANFDLTNEDIEIIEDFYKKNEETFRNMTKPKHIKKSSTTPPLPRSLVFIPKGRKQGLYILCKTKEIGLGSWNRVTLAFHLQTGTASVFRSGKRSDVSEREIEINNKLLSYPEYFAAGVPVLYEGPYRKRNRDPMLDKNLFFQKQNTKKIGFIMDYIEGGELFDKVLNSRLDHDEIVKISFEYTKILCFLKELNIIHFDQKLENTFVTNEGKLKLGDFGLATPPGLNLTRIGGSKGAISPELIKMLYPKEFYGQYTTDFPADVWSAGVLMADLRSVYWRMLCGQIEGNYKKILNIRRLNHLKNFCIPERENPEHVDYVIDKCLQLNPEDRWSIEEVHAYLSEMLADITVTEST